jgi:23S rRNA (cytidine1920-2'-O)/16S rRNA (cytidine1409-2'-O)-methyltransferase
LGREPIPKKAQSERARLDVLIVERGLATSRERAQAMLLAGQVRVNGQRVDKPGARVPVDARVEIMATRLPYASRAGQKLEGALADFLVSPHGKICLDLGSSTGGFTDCLLQHGAMKVYAVDVTIDQLEWKLRQDERVVPIERNARYLQPSDVDEPPTLVTMDLAFISVDKVLPAVLPVAARGADFLVLIKPQFELEKREVGKGGIVRDPALHRKAIERVTGAAAQHGLQVIGVRPSHISGTEGNQEFFLHAHKPV